VLKKGETVPKPDVVDSENSAKVNNSSSATTIQGLPPPLAPLSPLTPTANLALNPTDPELLFYAGDICLWRLLETPAETFVKGLVDGDANANDDANVNTSPMAARQLADTWRMLSLLSIGSFVVLSIIALIRCFR